MCPTKDGVSTNDAKFLPRSEPQKASSKQCGRFKRVKEKGSLQKWELKITSTGARGKDQCLSETMNN